MQILDSTELVRSRFRSTIRIFLSFAHDDLAQMEHILGALGGLGKEFPIDIWVDRRLSAGTEIDPELAARVDLCDIFVGVVSSSFLRSDYCMNFEVRRVLGRIADEHCLLVPLIVGECTWKESVLSSFLSIPRDGSPADPSRPEVQGRIINEFRSLLHDFSTRNMDC